LVVEEQDEGTTPALRIAPTCLVLSVPNLVQYSINGSKKIVEHLDAEDLLFSERVGLEQEVPELVIQAEHKELLA